MKSKRLIGVIRPGAVLVVAGGYLLVRSWSVTPYGRLDPRVAVYLKLTGAAESGERDLNIPIHESRARLAKTAASVSGAPVEMASVEDMTAKARGSRCRCAYTPRRRAAPSRR